MARIIRHAGSAVDAAVRVGVSFTRVPAEEGRARTRSASAPSSLRCARGGRARGASRRRASRATATRRLRRARRVAVAARARGRDHVRAVPQGEVLPPRSTRRARRDSSARDLPSGRNNAPTCGEGGPRRRLGARSRGNSAHGVVERRVVHPAPRRARPQAGRGHAALADGRAAWSTPVAACSTRSVRSEAAREPRRVFRIGHDTRI